MGNRAGSTPALGTFKDAEHQGVSNNYNYFETPASADAALISLLKLVEPSMTATHKYTKPTLIIPDINTKDQRWYIKFMVWSEDEKKMVRKRFYQINNPTDLVERKLKAKVVLKQIEKLLKEGHIIDSNKPIIVDKRSEKIQINLKEGIEKFLYEKNKLRPTSIKNYKYYIGSFLKYLEENKYHLLPITWFDDEHCESYMHNLIIVQKLSNRTYNNFKGSLSTLFNYFIKKKYTKQNPFSTIEKLNAGMGRNMAYSAEQKKELLDFAALHEPNLLRAMKAMYYTLIRTNELSRIKIWMIGAYDPNKIYLPKEISKNGHERHIMIHPELLKIFSEMKIDTQPKENYLFSKGFLPGPTHYKSNQMGNYYGEKVLRKLNYSFDYTFYSWKHSGVVDAKNSGMTDAAIIIQGGWREMKSYQTYLKSLGLENNTEFIDKMPIL